MVLYTKHRSSFPYPFSLLTNSDTKDKVFTEDELARPDEEEEARVAELTKKKLEEKLQKKIAAAQHIVAKNTAEAKPKYFFLYP